MTAVSQPLLARPSPAGGVAGHPDPRTFRFRFRLTTGAHVDSVPVYDADGEPLINKKTDEPVMQDRYFHALGKAAPEHCQPNDGNLIATNQDLGRLNVPGYRPKFERVHDDKPAGAITAEELATRGLTEDVLRQLLETYAPRDKAQPPAPPEPVRRQPINLEAMSYKQLQEHAAAEEVPGYEGAKNKAELITMITRHGTGPRG